MQASPILPAQLQGTAARDWNTSANIPIIPVHLLSVYHLQRSIDSGVQPLTACV